MSVEHRYVDASTTGRDMSIASLGMRTGNDSTVKSDCNRGNNKTRFGGDITAPTTKQSMLIRSLLHPAMRFPRHRYSQTRIFLKKG